MNLDQDTDSPVEGTVTDGPVGDLTSKEFVLINPPKFHYACFTIARGMVAHVQCARRDRTQDTTVQRL